MNPFKMRAVPVFKAARIADHPKEPWVAEYPQAQRRDASEAREADEREQGLLECSDRAGTAALFMVSIWYPLTPKIGDMEWKEWKQWKLWQMRKASKYAGFRQAEENKVGT